MKTLSIIVPSYNTSSYINVSLPTFIDEELFEEIEILIINDGSTDDTSKIAHQYEKKYPQLFRVIDKENGGHGSVINTGAKEAVGKYIKVVDGDDWVETDNLVKLVKELKNCDSDVILNPYYTVDASNNNKRKMINIPVKCDTYQFEEISDKIPQFQIHTMTIKTEILRKIHLTEKCFYDDFEYDLFPVLYVRSVKILDFPVYDYLIGQKTQSVSDKSVLKNHMMEKKILWDSIAFYSVKKSKISDIKKRYFKKNICSLGKSAYNIYLRNYKEKNSYRLMKEFDGELKEYSEYFYDLIGDTYKYVNILRIGKKFTFILVSNMLIAYKKLSGRHN